MFYLRGPNASYCANTKAPKRIILYRGDRIWARAAATEKRFGLLLLLPRLDHRVATATETGSSCARVLLLLTNSSVLGGGEATKEKRLRW